MPELDPSDPHRASAGARWHPSLPARPYTYRGLGYDIYDTPEFDHSQIPAGCTCTWAWGPPGFRWERIGPKESCPWHRVADTLGTRRS